MASWKYPFCTVEHTILIFFSALPLHAGIYVLSCRQQCQTIIFDIMAELIFKQQHVMIIIQACHHFIIFKSVETDTALIRIYYFIFIFSSTASSLTYVSSPAKLKLQVPRTTVLNLCQPYSSLMLKLL